MDLAVKKIELINWLTHQDEGMIRKIDALRKSSVKTVYKVRMEEDLDAKLSRSQADIASGRIQTQQEVESYFENRFKS